MESNGLPKWQIVWERKVERQLAKMDAVARQRIRDQMNSIARLPDPRLRGKALTGPRKGQWRYRVGDYRIICKIYDMKVIITVIDVGHRKEIYE